MCTERLGDLHSKGGYASRRAVDQNLLPRLNLFFVTTSLQCSQRRERHRSRLLERQVIGLPRQCRLGNAYILGQRPAAQAEHWVTWLELGHSPANCLDFTGHVRAQSRHLWLAQPRSDTKHVGHTSYQVPVNWIDGSRANFYQHLVVLGNRLFHVVNLDDVRRSVSPVDCSFHGRSRFALTRSWKRCTFTPLTISQRQSDISPTKEGRRMAGNIRFAKLGAIISAKLSIR